MEWSAPATLDSITFNGTSPPAYLLDPNSCSGIDFPAIRAPVDNKPQTDGAIIFPFKFGPIRITLGGLLWATDASSRNTLEANLQTALGAILASDGTFTITPTGMSATALTVRCEIPMTISGGFLKTFLFGLISDPFS